MPVLVEDAAEAVASVVWSRVTAVGWGIGEGSARSGRALAIPWQGSQERPVARSEPRPGLAQLPLQDRDLVTQRHDLHVFVPVTHQEQPQKRERARHTQIGKSKQHSRSSCSRQGLRRTTSSCGPAETVM
jgi:hypothetical protein